MTPHTNEPAIREQAYYFWEEEGRPDGRETEFWMRAVVALTAKTQLDTMVEPAPAKAKSKSAPAKSKAAPAKTAKANKTARK